MKNIVWLLVLFSNITFAQRGQEFPIGPNPRLTPGQLCTHPVEYRYPEHISYCGRDVSTEEKEYVFQLYRRLGFRLPPNQRSSYKIDHLVPLCAGGSNEVANLWPQHMSVYRITDPIEELACKKMSQGRIRQADAVRLIIYAKQNLGQAKLVMQELARK